MKNLIEILIWLGFIFLAQNTFGQNITQTIRGNVVDKESQAPLIGAEVAVLTTETMTGTTTDLDGSFKIEDLPIGRHNLQITFRSNEPMTVIIELDKKETLNEMATGSVRSFRQDTGQPFSDFQLPG